MTFDDIVGLDDIKNRLLAEFSQNRMAHAIMLCGQEGCGALPLSIAFAQKILDNNIMAEKLQHPDLHFAFPIYNKSKKGSVCDEFLKEWRELCTNRTYFGMEEWMLSCKAENQQLIIYERESDAIYKKLSLKSSQGGYKIMIIWQPEKMHESCSNKLLKLIEEPPEQTLFLLVSEQPNNVLATIRSRCQIIECPPVDVKDIENTLINKYKIDQKNAVKIARASNGNMLTALRSMSENSDNETFLTLFQNLMRLSYSRKVREIKDWSEEIAKFGRERQKSFLLYCQKMIRENFIYNFNRHDDLNYMNKREADFAVRFAPFINERNVIGMMDEFNSAQRDISQNANAKIVFFDLGLKMIVLIKNR